MYSILFIIYLINDHFYYFIINFIIKYLNISLKMDFIINLTSY